jgi:hypothetical protein
MAGQPQPSTSPPAADPFAWYAWDDPRLDTSIAEAVVAAREKEPIRNTTELQTVVVGTDYSVLNQQGDIAFKAVPTASSPGRGQRRRRNGGGDRGQDRK